MTNKSQRPLSLRAGELANFSSALLTLAENAPKRMTLPQYVFFLNAALADISGTPATFGEIKEHVGDAMGRSLHTTYRILLEPSKAFPEGLSWLRQDVDPNDLRVKPLRLTDAGAKVVRDALEAATGRS